MKTLILKAITLCWCLLYLLFSVMFLFVWGFGTRFFTALGFPMLSAICVFIYYLSMVGIFVQVIYSIVIVALVKAEKVL